MDQPASCEMIETTAGSRQEDPNGGLERFPNSAVVTLERDAQYHLSITGVRGRRR